MQHQTVPFPGGGRKAFLVLRQQASGHVTLAACARADLPSGALLVGRKNGHWIGAWHSPEAPTSATASLRGAFVLGPDPRGVLCLKWFDLPALAEARPNEVRFLCAPGLGPILARLIHPLLAAYEAGSYRWRRTKAEGPEVGDHDELLRLLLGAWLRSRGGRR